MNLRLTKLSNYNSNRSVSSSSCPSNWTVSVSLYIVRLYSCHALIARYVRDFANVLRFSRFMRLATNLALLNLLLIDEWYYR